MAPETSLLSPTCVFLPVSALLFSVSSVFQVASSNAIPLKCVRSSLFFILLLIFLGAIPYLHLHTNTDTHSPRHYHLHPGTSRSESWHLSCAPDPDVQPRLDVIRHSRASSSASLPLGASSFSWIPYFDWWQIAVTYPVTSHCQTFDVSVILPNFLLAHHAWPSESLLLPVSLSLSPHPLPVVTASCPDSQTLILLLPWSLPHWVARCIFLKWICSWSLTCLGLCGSELSYPGRMFNSLGNREILRELVSLHVCGCPELLVTFQTLCLCPLCQLCVRHSPTHLPRLGSDATFI